MFATGFGSGDAELPSYPGMVWSFAFLSVHSNLNVGSFQDTFKGEFIHSARFKKASTHEGKKVAIVGACNSGPFV